MARWPGRALGFKDASIGSIVKVNGKSAAEHVAGLGGKPPASMGRGEKPKVALKAGAVPHHVAAAATKKAAILGTTTPSRWPRARASPRRCTGDPPGAEGG